MHPTQKLRDILLLTGFLLGIGLPFLDTFLGWDPAPAPEENRVLRDWPSLPGRGRDPALWTQDLARAHRDRFGLRSSLLWLQRKVWVEALGVSPDPRVILGRDGWLFHRTRLLREVAGSLEPWTPSDRGRLERRYRERAREIESLGARYCLVMIPEKALVMPGRLPLPLDRFLGSSSRWRGLGETLERAGVRSLDLGPVLERAQSSGPVYWKTDFHWNTRGMVAALPELLRFLGKGKEAESWSRRIRVRRVGERPGGYLAERIEGTGRFPEEWYELEFEGGEPRVDAVERTDFDARWRATEYRSRVPGRTGRILFLHDSFLRPLRRIMAEEFAWSLFLDCKEEAVSIEKIREEGVDEVVQVLWSHYLLGRLPALPREGAEGP